MKLSLLPFILAAMLISCEQKNEEFVLQSGQNQILNIEHSTKKLEGKNIGPTGQFGLIQDLYFVDEKLLLHDVKADDVLLVYNLKDQLKKHFSKGQGPNQFSFPETMKLGEIRDLKNELPIFEFGKGIYKLHLEKEEKTAAFISKDYQLPANIQDASLIGENKVAFVDTDGSTIFSIYDILSRKIKNIELQPAENLTNAAEYASQASPVDIEFNEKHDLIITWSGLMNKISLFRRNGDLLKSYRFGSNKNIENDTFERKYFYYYNLKSKGDYVYALYAGFNTVGNFVETVIPLLKTEVHVFNLQTDEVQVYQLDRLINACTIDFENGIIYAIEENNENQPLVKYEIN